MTTLERDPAAAQAQRRDTGVLMRVLGGFLMLVAAFAAWLVPDDIRSGISMYTGVVVAMAIAGVALWIIGTRKKRRILTETHGRHDTGDRRAA